MKTIKKEDALRERERREGDDGLVKGLSEERPIS